MTRQTAAAIVAEYRAARAEGNDYIVTDILLAAIDHDRANPGGLRLMDRLRAAQVADSAAGGA